MLSSSGSGVGWGAASRLGEDSEARLAEDSRRELVQVLCDLGTTEKYAARAVQCVNPRAEGAIDLLFQWMKKNPPAADELTTGDGGEIETSITDNGAEEYVPFAQQLLLEAQQREREDKKHASAAAAAAELDRHSVDDDADSEYTDHTDHSPVHANDDKKAGEEEEEDKFQPQWEPMVAKMIDLGFTKDESRKMLVQTSGDLIEAIQLLIAKQVTRARAELRRVRYKTEGMTPNRRRARSSKPRPLIRAQSGRFRWQQRRPEGPTTSPPQKEHNAATGLPRVAGLATGPTTPRRRGRTKSVGRRRVEPAKSSSLRLPPAAKNRLRRGLGHSQSGILRPPAPSRSVNFRSPAKKPRGPPDRVPVQAGRPLPRSRSTHVILTGTGSQEPAATKADRAKNAAVFRMQLLGQFPRELSLEPSGSSSCPSSPFPKTHESGRSLSGGLYSTSPSTGGSPVVSPTRARPPRHETASPRDSPVAVPTHEVLARAHRQRELGKPKDLTRRAGAALARVLAMEEKVRGKTGGTSEQHSLGAAAGSGSDLMSLAGGSHRTHKRSASTGPETWTTGGPVSAQQGQQKLKMLSSQVLKLQDMVLAYQDKYQSIRKRGTRGKA